MAPAWAEVAWTGATPSGRDARGSTASVVLSTPGPHRVAVEVHANGELLRAAEVELTASPLGPEGLRLTALRLGEGPTFPGVPAPGGDVRLFFLDQSIARLRQLSPERYRTSINRWVVLEADVDPPELAPLVEWRIDGVVQRHLGAPLRLRLFTTGEHALAVGSQEIYLETYRVTILAPPPGTDLPEGVAINYLAVTEPPGLENEVSWLAATMFGSALPALGFGREFTVRFDDTVGILESTGQRAQWFGVKADHTTLGQDDKSFEGELPLPIDPTWPATPGPIDSFPGPRLDGSDCAPEVAPILADADGDGELEVVGLRALGSEPGDCQIPVRYCIEEHETFREITGGPVFAAELPIPLAAFSDGCAGVPAAPFCPFLSNGQQALGCAGIAPATDCQTITVCPERSAWPNSEDPTQEVIQTRNADAPPPAFGPPADALEPGPLLVINPCDWREQVTDRTLPSVGTPPQNPEAMANGERCSSTSDCRSGRCERGYCTDDLFGNLFRGSEDWNIHLAGGIQDLHATGRGTFYPSLDYRLVASGTAQLETTLFGKGISLLALEARAEATECGLGVHFSEDHIGGASPDHEFESETDSELHERCLTELVALRAGEQKLNESLHDALVAWWFWNQAGPVGAHVTSREAAQGYIDRYLLAFFQYQARLEDFQEIQAVAAAADFDYRLPSLRAKFPVGPIGGSFPVGPFDIGFEVGAVLELGLDGGVEGEAQFNLAAATSRADLRATLTPRATATAYAHVYAGVGNEFIGADVGFRGSLDLVALQLPIRTELGLSLPVSSLADPALPPALGPFVSGFLFPASQAELRLPFVFGANLRGPGGEARASFLSGRIEGVARAEVCVPFIGCAGKEWTKTLVTWPGLRKSWTLGMPADRESEAATPLAETTVLGRLPNMVTLPLLELSPVPGSRPAAQVDAELALLLGPGHQEADLNLQWIPRGGTTVPAKGKCPGESDP